MPPGDLDLCFFFANSFASTPSVCASLCHAEGVCGGGLTFFGFGVVDEGVVVPVVLGASASLRPTASSTVIAG
eukprot:CAMPEP_0181199960 /NCGR_PEP_ID=MMETSP1096-20121128/17481_1 /TAXON_ID=156174 ORGANISM="Chrysochromulina ericina, Strain CCMP281" /NCGR_SAMPLE_ID=MMETSP1096 /ASSEMBLY_ACC=CAM_ASM_000453 /LENGTH=72 /DNA_ID=CAMNT_0023290229 /DNA_START=730 /DNA_END=944 /DNA_ORIENTATION=+